jgi:hypothetical protein
MTGLENLIKSNGEVFMSKQLRGFKAYEKDVCEMLNFESFDGLSKDDMDGCYGVAMVMAYVWDGVSPTLFELANWLNIPSSVLEQPYDRLRINGVFSSNYNARKDSALLIGAPKVYNSSGLNLEFTWANVTSSKAFGIIHGVAAGLAGVR